MKEREPQKVFTKEEKILRFSWRAEEDFGALEATEDDIGLLTIKIANKNGKEIVLTDLLPEGYETIRSGSKKILREVKRFGLGISSKLDTSIADCENKAIIVSELEMKGEGIKYLLTFLHELGHIKIDEASPQLREERRLAGDNSDRNPEDEELFKQEELLIAKNERDAWAFAIREFRKITKQLVIPQNSFFSDASELKTWILQISLGAKAEWINTHMLQRLSLSEKEKTQLADEIIKMYTHKK